jgi:single-strand DNA-binding protein
MESTAREIAMAASLNKVMLIGNVGRDPEMRFTPGGTAVTTFSVATNRRVRAQDGQWTDETEWHNIVTFEKLAEQCNEYLTKGRKVYIEGRLQTRSWDDQQSGQKKYRTEIVANTMQMLDQRPRDDGSFGDIEGRDLREPRELALARNDRSDRSGDRAERGGRGSRDDGYGARGGVNGASRGGDNEIDLDDTPF